MAEDFLKYTLTIETLHENPVLLSDVVGLLTEALKELQDQLVSGEKSKPGSEEETPEDDWVRPGTAVTIEGMIERSEGGFDSPSELLN